MHRSTVLRLVPLLCLVISGGCDDPCSQVAPQECAVHPVATTGAMTSSGSESPTEPTTDSTTISGDCDGNACGPGEDYMNCPMDCSCGNSSVDALGDGADEVCDDGPANSDDWALGKHCNATCTGFGAEYCGNGAVEAGHELCDEGMRNSDDYSMTKHCNAECTGWAGYCGDDTCQSGEDCPDDCMGVCGDDKVNQPTEECDGGVDGNATNTKDCDEDCTKPICNDGVFNTQAEPCDDFNVVATDACNNCVAAKCGDGVVWAGMEPCDDGNPEDKDMCSNECLAPRYVFVTSLTYVPGEEGQGGFIGTAGADEKCTSLGSGKLGDPTHTWVAWLSDDASAPVDRMDTDFTGWYLRPDGAPVAKGWADLTDGNLENPINVTEGKTKPAVALSAWTNTTIDGLATSVTDHCAGWTIPDGLKSASGNISMSDKTWTEAATKDCSNSLRLYCFETL